MAGIQVSQKRIVRLLKQTRDQYIPDNLRRHYLFRLLQNFIFQGFAGAHWTEIIFRIFLEFVVVVSLVIFLSRFTHYSLLFILLLSHFFMWTLNGHFWALKINENRRLTKNSPKRIRRYLLSLERRLNQTEAITACILSGSLTSVRFHEYSDLDVWFTKNRGFLNGLLAYLFGVRERCIAFLQKIPIELYFYDTENYTGKDPGETLLLVKDNGKRWKMIEPDSIYFDICWLNETEFFKNH